MRAVAWGVVLSFAVVGPARSQDTTGHGFWSSYAKRVSVIQADQLRSSAPAAQPSPAACTSPQEFFATDCPLTWHGITLYGAYDVGVGWVSHGMPVNGYNYEGESLVNRNGDHSRWLIAPNNLQQTGLGIRGREEFMHDWFIVFNASTGINPQSGQLAKRASHHGRQCRPSQGQLFGHHRRLARGPAVQ